MRRESSKPHRLRRRLLCSAAALSLVPAVLAGYVPTMRDTGLPGPPVEYAEVTVPEGGEYALLAEIGYLRYFFRDDRDVIAVVDTRNGYTWKTGLDVPFNSDVDRAVAGAGNDEEALLKAAVPKEDRLNATYIAMANSLLTAEYYDDARNIALLSSASQKGAQSKLYAAGDGHFLLDAAFSEIDLTVRMHIYLTGTGIRYEIRDEELSGEGLSSLAALLITPFLGASGGTQLIYDRETRSYGDPVRKPMIPGYILMPDGPGALMRFRENSAPFKKYIGSVYGVNHADATFHVSAQLETVPYKEPLMPVYGVAHGDRQAAFVFWADGGMENLELTVSPEGNMTSYNYAYPRFVYNQTVYQVYNRRGDGFTRLYPERNHFDIDATYTFLAGDGSADGLPADYTGMALAYRGHLLQTGRLAERAAAPEMPIHFDFVMSDVKKDIFRYRNMVVTTAGDVDNILRDLAGAGLRGINAGLLGAQKGGITAGKPWKLAFTGSIGTKKDFTDLIGGLAELGCDVYFTQDYSAINSLQMLTGPNMAYHRTSWGVRRYIEYENTSVPISEISFARPEKSVEWLGKQTQDMKKTGAVSVGLDGVSNRLISHYGSRPTTAAEAVRLLRDAVSGLEMAVSAYTPNQYLWDMTDRFINAPVLPTQYVIETDTVPFLQMVLNGTMELYGPYANFSFYTKEDVLRMIDYNVFPSFVLTEKPAYLLADTNSAGFYSTSYDLYRDIIIGIYNDMSAVYGQIADRRWVGRDVLENGVVLNTYGGGTRVVINYTGEPVTVDGREAPPCSAVVWGGDAP
ncbi:MAG: DUF5696 domain-containing protein [Oscillospiraceae bacterium]|jgi:hypothetical protein|nr:DUF5696 domain-containing protein [Oscillospiraceae bacterium]